MAAGISGMPVWRFFLFCWVGKIIKMGLFALAGAYSITWVTGLFR
jgi:membrane protein DedA with SNARE-associated domain